jgi:hypothetical protein
MANKSRISRLIEEEFKRELPADNREEIELIDGLSSTKVIVDDIWGETPAIKPTNFDRLFETSITKPLFNTLIDRLEFVWGASTPPKTDCVGLVIAFLRYHGYSCPWENEIPRRFREYEESREHMISRGFVPDSAGHVFLLNIYPHAHIGFIEQGLAYHQTLAGLRTQQCVGIVDRFTYEGE